MTWYPLLLVYTKLNYDVTWKYELPTAIIVAAKDSIDTIVWYSYASLVFH